MKKKMPALTRTPSGLRKEVIAAVRKKGTDAGVSGQAVRQVIEGDDGEGGDDDDEAAAAREFLSSLSSIEPVNIWWILENRDVEERTAAELGLDAERERLESEASENADGAREYLRDRYVYSTFRDEVWDRQAGDWISTKALTNSEIHRMPWNPYTGAPCNPFDLFRLDPQSSRVHNERFVPGVHEEIVRVPEKPGVDWLNTWVAPSIEPKKGSSKIIEDHILYLCNGNQEHADHILNWLAYAYQNPGAKINHALLIISGYQGVGKDTLALAMARILGPENVPFLDDDAIAEGRNEYMKRAQLIVIPEVMCGDRKDVANKMKPIITQSMARVNEKNVKPYWVPNCANVAMFSNHTNAAYIEDGDRRHFVIICKARPMSPEYYDRLYEYIEGDEIAGFAWSLQNRDLSDWNPKANAPDTEYKQTVRAATQAGWEAWLEDAWHSGAAPFDKDVINMRDALTVITEAKAPRMTTQQVAQFLSRKDIGGGDLGKPRIGEGKKQLRVWAVRDFEAMSAEPKEVLGLAYEGMPWKRASIAIQSPKHKRNVPDHRLIEAMEQSAEADAARGAAE